MKFTEIAIIIAYYIISAFATTDILRLLKGSSTPVLQAGCFCPVCNHKLGLFEQFPLISYFFRKGRCKYCKSKIPVSNLYFEIFLSVSLIAISLLSNFSFTGYLISITAYELTKLVSITIIGRRENDFLKNLFLSFLQNIVIFFILAVLFVINSSVQV